jgi:UDP-glucose 4-epimerase
MDIVTGGAGFIGSRLVARLREMGREVESIDYREPICPVDLRGGLSLPKGEINTVYHLAALASIVPSIQNPRDYYDTNVTGTLNVLEAARNAGCKRFVYAASSSCYGIPSQYPTPETAPHDPQYPYALTKMMGEQLVLHWARVYGLPAVSLRIFNAYGPGHRTDGAYGAMFGVFLAQMANGKPITIVGDGEQQRDFVHVDDVVEAFILAAESDKTGECYNVGSGSPVSINTIADILGAESRAYIPKRPGEPDITWADISKIQRELSWQPEITIMEGVEQLRQSIGKYRAAPLWTPETIAEATKDWHKCLGKVA